MSIITNMVTIVVAAITTTKITGQNKLASLICGLHTSHRIYLSDSLQNKLASLICGLHTSHRIYLSDSLQNKLASPFVAARKPSDLSFRFTGQNFQLRWKPHFVCPIYLSVHYSERYQTYSIWYRFSIFIFKNLTKGIANTIPISPKSFPPTARAIIITTGFNLTLCSKTLGEIT